jgi:hypothetical protein
LVEEDGGRLGGEIGHGALTGLGEP